MKKFKHIDYIVFPGETLEEVIAKDNDPTMPKWDDIKHSYYNALEAIDLGIEFELDPETGIISGDNSKNIKK